jgi:hypothetical protein
MATNSSSEWATPEATTKSSGWPDEAFSTSPPRSQEPPSRKVRRQRRIAPAARVLTVGVDMKVNISRSTLVEAPIVLLVASGKWKRSPIFAR